MTEDRALFETCEMESKAAFSGWDFSHLDGRYEEPKLPWCYKEKLQNFLKPDSRLLDMGTGGGEFLLTLRHPYDKISVTEGYPPNVALCKERLAPLGITVKAASGEEVLPYEDESFDLIINRHESYRMDEIWRLLVPGGFFVTQQVGGENDVSLSKRLIPGFQPALPQLNLENEVPRFKKANFRVMARNQFYGKTKFHDVGAICYYANIIPWCFPGFDVSACFPVLKEMQQEIEAGHSIETECHRFLLVVKKPV